MSIIIIIIPLCLNFSSLNLQTIISWFGLSGVIDPIFNKDAHFIDWSWTHG